MEPSGDSQGSSEANFLQKHDEPNLLETEEAETRTSNYINQTDEDAETNLAEVANEKSQPLQTVPPGDTPGSNQKSRNDDQDEQESVQTETNLNTPQKKSDDDDDMTEEEAQEILMKALQKISPKIGKNFVLRFEDPSTKEVKEISSDKGKLVLGQSQLSKNGADDTASVKLKTEPTDEEDSVENHADLADDNTDRPTKNTKSTNKRRKMNISPIKRTPRTSTILKNLAKLDEKQNSLSSPVYHCEQCPSKFGIRSNLNKHVRMKHGLGLEIAHGSEENDIQDVEENEESEEEIAEKETQNSNNFAASTNSTVIVESPTVTEQKRGRGRPPKKKTVEKCSVVKSENTNEDTPKRGRGRPKKSRTSSGTEIPAKRAKVDVSYSDADICCFITILKEEEGFECKLCTTQLATPAIAKDHIISDHWRNLQQCTRTLDKFPDATRPCKWDSFIYTTDDTGVEEIMPTEIFSTPGRAGRKRTPSVKLLESQAASVRKYVCKVCHKKGASKTNILQHMKKFHLDLIPPEDEDTIDEEAEGEGSIEGSDNNNMDIVYDSDNDTDYRPSLQIDDDDDDDDDDDVEHFSEPETKSAKRGRKPKIKAIKTEDDEEEEVETTEQVTAKIKALNGETQDKNVDGDNSIKEEGSATITETKIIKAEKKTKYINNRARSRVYKKVPSYYIYCDHGEDDLEKKPPHDLPFCKSCDRFKCLTCTLTFNKSSHVNRHIRIVHQKEKKYVCDKCDARFTTNESLQYHNKWHIGVKDVECPHCEMKFLVTKNLRKHIRKHHPGLEPVRRKKSNVCEFCKSQFTRKERLEYHMLEKHPANNPDKECRICGQKFETDEQCYEHSNAHADLKKMPVAKCPHCPLYCSSKNNLKRHVDRVHLNIKKYLCTTCGKRFKGHDAFMYHMKRHADPDGRDYECHICKKKIASEKGLEIHLRIHSGIKPYVCETCGRGFAQKGNMLSHQAVHFDDRPFECTECKKTFKKKFDLFKHMKRHRIKQVVETGDLSVLKGAGKIYECPLSGCGGLFCSTSDLRLHVRKHNNERPYECEICFKTFAVKSRLVRHLRNVHLLQIPECDLELIKSAEYAEKIEMARENYEERKKKYQTVVIPQPSGEQIEVQIMTEDTEGVEDLLALSNATEFAMEKPKQDEKTENESEKQGEEIQLKIETGEEEGSKVQIINVQEDSTGQVQIHTDDDNIVLDPAIIQTLLNSGQQTIYYYVDQ